MDDLERFGWRLEASLRRLAEEVPTDVDADVYAAGVLRVAGRRRRLAVPWGRVDLSLPRSLRLALAVAALVAVALGMLLVAQGVRPAIVVGAVHGQLLCPATLVAAGSSTAQTCTSELSDPTLSGSVQLRLGPSTAFASTASRDGSLSISGPWASWTGPIRVVVAANGLIAGDGTLVGDGVGAGSRLQIRLVSGDGARWGLVGTVERIR